MASFSDQFDRQIARIDALIQEMDDMAQQHQEREVREMLILLWYNWFNMEYNQLFIDKQTNERFSDMYLCFNDLYLGEFLPVECYCVMFLVLVVYTHFGGDPTRENLRDLLVYTIAKARGGRGFSAIMIGEDIVPIEVGVDGHIECSVLCPEEIKVINDLELVDVEQCLFELLFCMSALHIL